MNYEIVQLEEKTVVGQSIRTSNNDPNMTSLIGSLWQRFYSNGIYQAIDHKKNDKSIGLYTSYEGDSKDAYDVMVCCEVEKVTEVSSGIVSQTIPAGKYAKFILQGDVHKVVADFWTKLWSMDLDRAYSCDFEEYQSGSDMNQAKIHIYISLKEE